ncbi:MAG: carboxymuconolactone decarboxylase family protein [Pseudomonadota bacterium]
MSRIEKLPPEKWDPRIVAAVKPEEATELEQGLTRFFAHCPEQALGLMAFGGALKMNRSLPDRMVELVRLRIAFFNQCRSCMAIRYSDALDDGLDEELVCSLEKPAESENLSDAEKIAIRYGELFARDHLAIDDKIHDQLREYFSEAQIVELGMTVAFFVGFGRLAATWKMVEELPAAFQDTSQSIAPWGEEAIQVR